MLQRLRATGLWWPTSAAFLVRSAFRGRTDLVPSDADALRAATDWVGRAQDATHDGGIAGRYALAKGWTSSYPETTGYAVPTLLALATALDDERYHARAARCVDFLLSVQLPDGAFPAGDVAENRTRPSLFNSAQIVHGLQCWHQATGESCALDAMVKAARWICDVQDADGAWRAHFYHGLACTYSAHAACWLAELGAYTRRSHVHDGCVAESLMGTPPSRRGNRMDRRMRLFRSRSSRAAGAYPYHRVHAAGNPAHGPASRRRGRRRVGVCGSPGPDAPVGAIAHAARHLES